VLGETHWSDEKRQNSHPPLLRHFERSLYCLNCQYVGVFEWSLGQAVAVLPLLVSQPAKQKYMRFPRKLHNDASTINVMLVPVKLKLTYSFQQTQNYDYQK
jgi:hypothetical protein